MFLCLVKGMKLTTFPTKFMMILLAGSQWGFGSGFSIWHYFGRIASCTISRGGEIGVFINDGTAGFGNRFFSFFFWVVIVCHNLLAIIGPDWNWCPRSICLYFRSWCLWVFAAGSLFLLICVKVFLNFSSRKFTKSSKVNGRCQFLPIGSRFATPVLKWRCF